MQVTIVHIHVNAEHLEKFIEATRQNHQASVRENGNRRFDLLQMSSDPTRFVLYEAYNHADEAAAHKETEHYLAWRNTVADWMAEPRQGVAYQALLPESS